METLFRQDEPKAETAKNSGRYFVKVAVERSIEREGAALDRGSVWESGVLTYRTQEEVPVGWRVEVPLGRSGKVEGVVVEAGGPELAGSFPVEKIKSILKVGDVGLPSKLVALAKWMAGYYVCPIGMVLGTMMPSAVKRAVGAKKVTKLTTTPILGELSSVGTMENKPGLKLTPSVKRVLGKMRDIKSGEWPMKPEELAARLGERTLRGINRLVEMGVLLKVEEEEVVSRGGLALGTSFEQGDGLGFEDAASQKTLLNLTDQQHRVVTGIGETLRQFGVHLIRGVTGSGKTEVYLRVIEGILEGDLKKTVIVLVPEISLTPQMGGRFERRLGRFGVAVLHSGLSASQRHQQWQRASLGSAPGGARVVVGARSAIFAPMENVGLIVVDEEHASDYKQDQLPRYHGRDLAIKRGQIEGCPVILGSATPSLESWVNAVGLKREGTSEGLQPGRYRLWELTERVGGAVLPRVEVVDLNGERQAIDARRRAMKAAGMKMATIADAGLGRMAELGEMIGPTLEGALAQTIRGGGQAVLLLNRRGYAGYIACADSGCGWLLRCDDCDAGMVFHKKLSGIEHEKAHGRVRVVRCHHCLAQQLLPEKCPACGKGLIWLGLGTQRVEEELIAKFGGFFGEEGKVGEVVGHEHGSPAAAWLARVDSDTMQSARDYFEILGKFSRGEIRVLVGTQMIAKGLDFPNVQLVGVINADTSLGLTDFRATERTFQLVSQVAGRAGRSAHNRGRVIVQTMEPDSPAIQCAAAHDYVGFATQELEHRRRSLHPPIAKMARIVIRDPVFEKAMSQAKTLAGALRHAAGEVPIKRGGMMIAGPMECPIARIANHYRVAIELTALGRGVLQTTLGKVRAKGMLKSDSRTAVDIDPIALA